MELAKAGQVSLEELSKIQFYAFFFADGSYPRSSFLLTSASIKASRTILLKQVENRILKKHWKISPFSVSGLEQLELKVQQGGKLMEYFDSILKTCRSKEIAILFDYSEMPETWYAGLFEYLLKHDLPCSRLTICFSYVPVTYRAPAGGSFFKSARPLIHGSKVNNGNIQKALIMDLGFSPQKALYLIRKIKPHSVFLLYPDPALNLEYTGKILQLNQSLILKAEPSHLVPYPIQDTEKAEEIISSLAFDLRLSYRVLLAPLGPKIFTLLCLMVYARFPDIEIWSTGSAEDLAQHEFPLHDPLVIKSVFTREDDSD